MVPSKNKVTTGIQTDPFQVRKTKPILHTDCWRRFDSSLPIRSANLTLTGTNLEQVVQLSTALDSGPLKWSNIWKKNLKKEGLVRAHKMEEKTSRYVSSEICSTTLRALDLRVKDLEDKLHKSLSDDENSDLKRRKISDDEPKTVVEKVKSNIPMEDLQSFSTASIGYIPIILGHNNTTHNDSSSHLSNFLNLFQSQTVNTGDYTQQTEQTSNAKFPPRNCKIEDTARSKASKRVNPETLVPSCSRCLKLDTQTGEIAQNVEAMNNEGNNSYFLCPTTGLFKKAPTSEHQELIDEPTDPKKNDNAKRSHKKTENTACSKKSSQIRSFTPSKYLYHPESDVINSKKPQTYSTPSTSRNNILCAKKTLNDILNSMCEKMLDISDDSDSTGDSLQPASFEEPLHPDLTNNSNKDSSRFNSVASSSSIRLEREKHPNYCQKGVLNDIKKTNNDEFNKKVALVVRQMLRDERSKEKKKHKKRTKRSNNDLNDKTAGRRKNPCKLRILKPFSNPRVEFASESEYETARKKVKKRIISKKKKYTKVVKRTDLPRTIPKDFDTELALRRSDRIKGLLAAQEPNGNTSVINYKCNKKLKKIKMKHVKRTNKSRNKNVISRIEENESPIEPNEKEAAADSIDLNSEEQERHNLNHVSKIVISKSDIEACKIFQEKKANKENESRENAVPEGFNKDACEDIRDKSDTICDTNNQEGLEGKNRVSKNEEEVVNLIEIPVSKANEIPIICLDGVKTEENASLSDTQQRSEILMGLDLSEKERIIADDMMEASTTTKSIHCNRNDAPTYSHSDNEVVAPITNPPESSCNALALRYNCNATLSYRENATIIPTTNPESTSCEVAAFHYHKNEAPYAFGDNATIIPNIKGKTTSSRSLSLHYDKNANPCSFRDNAVSIPVTDMAAISCRELYNKNRGPSFSNDNADINSEGPSCRALPLDLHYDKNAASYSFRDNSVITPTSGGEATSCRVFDLPYNRNEAARLFNDNAALVPTWNAETTSCRAPPYALHYNKNAALCSPRHNASITPTANVESTSFRDLGLHYNENDTSRLFRGHTANRSTANSETTYSRAPDLQDLSYNNNAASYLFEYNAAITQTTNEEATSSNPFALRAAASCSFNGIAVTKPSTDPKAKSCKSLSLHHNRNETQRSFRGKAANIPKATPRRVALPPTFPIEPVNNCPVQFLGQNETIRSSNLMPQNRKSYMLYEEGRQSCQYCIPPNYAQSSAPLIPQVNPNQNNHIRTQNSFPLQYSTTKGQRNTLNMNISQNGTHRLPSVVPSFNQARRTLQLNNAVFVGDASSSFVGRFTNGELDNETLSIVWQGGEETFSNKQNRISESPVNQPIRNLERINVNPYCPKRTFKSTEGTYNYLAQKKVNFTRIR